MKRMTFSVVVVMTLILLFSGYVRAQEGMHPPSPEKGLNPMILEEAQKQAGITDEQIKAVKEVMFLHMKETIRMRADIRIAELDLHHALDTDKPDREKIMKMIDEIGLMKTKLEKANMDMRLKLKGIIKPEQEKKLREFMKKKLNARRAERGAKGFEGRRSSRGQWMDRGSRDEEGMQAPEKGKDKGRKKGAEKKKSGRK